MDTWLWICICDSLFVYICIACVKSQLSHRSRRIATRRVYHNRPRRPQNLSIGQNDISTRRIQVGYMLFMFPFVYILALYTLLFMYYWVDIVKKIWICFAVGAVVVPAACEALLDMSRLVERTAICTNMCILAARIVLSVVKFYCQYNSTYFFARLCRLCLRLLNMGYQNALIVRTYSKNLLKYCVYLAQSYSKET